MEQHPLFIAAKTVLLYYSLGDEVQTHDFIEKWYRQKDILLPVVKGDILELRRYTGPQNLQTGEAYHIEEPTGEAFTDYTQIDFAIIPGVSFDKNVIREEIIERDNFDKNRKINPLTIAEDATIIDTSYMTIEEVENKITKLFMGEVE